MARQERNDVDYFPHPVNHGKKMHYILTKYKNDGYTVWMRLLEELGKANYHYLDLDSEIHIMYLSSEFLVTEELLLEIIADLVKLEEFDKELYDNKILFNESFKESIKDAYKKRNNPIISKAKLITILLAKGRLKDPIGAIKPPKGSSKGDGNPQSKVEERIEDESIVEIQTENFVSLQDYEDYREYMFSHLDESFKQALKENVGIDRPYVWVNRKVPEEYFDLVECLVKVKEDVEWRASIQQNNNISKDQLLTRLYEFVKTIKDSKEYLGYHGYDASDGKDNFITHFARWLRVKLNYKSADTNKKGSSVGVNDF